jgi:hypothetical protein
MKDAVQYTQTIVIIIIKGMGKRGPRGVSILIAVVFVVHCFPLEGKQRALTTREDDHDEMR